jgi:hypothetical protein
MADFSYCRLLTTCSLSEGVPHSHRFRLTEMCEAEEWPTLDHPHRDERPPQGVNERGERPDVIGEL